MSTTLSTAIQNANLPRLPTDRRPSHSDVHNVHVGYMEFLCLVAFASSNFGFYFWFAALAPMII